ncbi:metallophosphoesterase family protein [Moorella sulfitireducens]|uniref:metallophosphoesterase family protein n=1 Tax=Neomoorella sulfitireducens TaxID=2972948 RepID=UPI0021ABD536|nr:metallophosphoesterase [Moorella sulfitireducens]
MARIFFATDIHGSEICWKKFINAGKFYQATTIILGGDMTGKALVPLVRAAAGSYRASFLEEQVNLKEDEVPQFAKMVANRGYYPIVLTEDEFQELNQNPEAVHRRFKENVLKVAERWAAYADERLGQWGIKCFICPGNDDMFELDEVFRQSRHVRLAEEEILEVAPGWLMASTGWSNPTPWKTYRECDEETLLARLENIIAKVVDMEHCIFNFHAPPYGSGLDEAPELDSSLRPKFAGRSLVPVGSHAVRQVVEKYQPPLGLFGHIHEGKGVKRLGRTICLNPGSSYEQGILLGAVIDLDGIGVKKYVLTSG